MDRLEFEALITQINEHRGFHFKLDSIKDGAYTMHDAVNDFTATYTRTPDGQWELVHHTQTPEKAMPGTHGIEALKVELALRRKQRELERERRTAPRPRRPPPRLGWRDKLRNLWPWGRGPTPPVPAAAPAAAPAPAPAATSPPEGWVSLLHPKAPQAHASSTLLF